MPVPDEFPAAIFMADDPNENNKDKEVNQTIENTFVGGNYSFSLGKKSKGLEFCVQRQSKKC